MPDHIHLLWLGIADSCDQRSAARYFRQQLTIPLRKLGCELQSQPYDHVLRDEERQETAFATIADYIARNPERAGLVPVDRYQEYPFTSCLVPGYPDLLPWQSNYWDRFWRLYSRLCNHGLLVKDVDTSERNS
jgi:hypothetical protein